MLTQTFNVRFYETDALAHVNNTVVAGWFETGREPIFRIFSPQLDLQNWPLIIASVKVDFLQQIVYGNEVEIRTYISRMGRSSFDVYQEVWQQGECRAKGLCTMVRFDYKSQSAVPLDDTIRHQLEAHAIDLN